MSKKASRSFSVVPPLRRLFLGAFMALNLHIPLAMAQVRPPTVLPGGDESLGGYGDACVGLAQMIRTGDLHLRQLPCFIKFFSQTLIAVAGSLSVIFVMIGGYRLMLGSVDEKDAAKRTITNALIGLAVSLMAWILVDTFLRFVTE